MLVLTHTRILRLALLPRLSTGSLFELIGEAHTFFRAVGFAVGISVSLSSASAEIEEAFGQEGHMANYTDDNLTHDLITNFLVNNYDSPTDQQVANELFYDLLYNGTTSRHAPTDDTNTTTHWDGSGRSTDLDNFAGASIPEAIWSLDVSFDRVSGGFGSDSGMVLGGLLKSPDLWTKEFTGLWTDTTADRTYPVLLSLSQFQVASCGGGSSERKDMEHCNFSSISTSGYAAHSNVTGSSNNDAVITSNNNSDPVILSTATSTSTLENEPGAVPYQWPLVPPGINSFVWPGDLTYSSAPPDTCDGISVTCAAIQISPATPPIDSPTPLIDSSTSPDPPDLVIPITDPEPVSNPLPTYIPPLAATSVPETSTWIMIMIGFFIMVVACGRSPNPIKQRVLGILFKIAKKSFKCYTVQ
jgi:hypothetical protein